MRFLIVLLFSFSAFANWMQPQDIGVQNKPRYTTKKHCGSDCVKVGKKYNPNYMRFGEHQVDDIEKPKFKKVAVQTCTSTSDCETLNAAKACDPGQEVVMRLDLDPKEVYCSKPNGYEQKTVTGIYEDESLKSTYTASVQQKQQREAALSQIRKYRACGDKVINELIYRNNVVKSLSASQKAQILSAYSSIKALLEVGNLVEAKSVIDSEPLNAPLITQADKDALSSMIEGCL